MDRLTERFLWASLLYFILGIILGLLLIFWPEWPGAVRTVHVHIMLFGWLSMIAYAAGYGMVPRLKGMPLYRPKLAEKQFWFANASLLAMSFFWIVVAFQEKGTLAYAFAYAFLGISAVSVALSALLFVYNMIMTLLRR